MRITRRTSTAFLAPLRGALAVVFLFMALLQPGLYTAASAKGIDSASKHLATVTVEVKIGVHSGHGHDRHDHVAAGEVSAEAQDDASPHHGGKRFSDQGCEIHCAPIGAIPVEHLELQQPVVRCFEPGLLTSLRESDYAELIRPPRR